MANKKAQEFFDACNRRYERGACAMVKCSNCTISDEYEKLSNMRLEDVN